MQMLARLISIITLFLLTYSHSYAIELGNFRNEQYCIIYGVASGNISDSGASPRNVNTGLGVEWEGPPTYVFHVTPATDYVPPNNPITATNGWVIYATLGSTNWIKYNSGSAITKSQSLGVSPSLPTGPCCGDISKDWVVSGGVSSCSDPCPPNTTRGLNGTCKPWCPYGIHENAPGFELAGGNCIEPPTCAPGEAIIPPTNVCQPNCNFDTEVFNYSDGTCVPKPPPDCSNCQILVNNICTDPAPCEPGYGRDVNEGCACLPNELSPPCDPGYIRDPSTHVCVKGSPVGGPPESDPFGQPSSPDGSTPTPGAPGQPDDYGSPNGGPNGNAPDGTPDGTPSGNGTTYSPGDDPSETEGDGHSGRTGYFGDLTSPDRPSPAWQDKDVIDWTPLTSKFGSSSGNKLTGAFSSISNAYTQLVASPETPTFTFNIGGKPLVIDLHQFDTLASWVRSIISLLVYIGAVYISLKIWRLMA